MNKIIENNAKIIEIGEGEKYLKDNYIFFDKNLKRIDIINKIKKQIKKNPLKIVSFEDCKFPKSLQIKKEKKILNYFCIHKEVIKRLDTSIEYLRENGIKEEILEKIEKNKIGLGLGIYQSEKFKKEENEGENFIDNCILIQRTISYVLRNIYEENNKEVF